MKEICSHFEIIPLDGVSEVLNNNVILNDGISFDRLHSDALSVNNQPNSSDAGLAFSFSGETFIDKVSEDIYNRYSYPRYCVVIIYYTDGSHTVYGTPDYPVTAFIAKNIQRDSISMSLDTTISPFI